MFAFTESVDIAAPRSAVWNLMRDVRAWWLLSNPEHDDLDLLGDDGALTLGKTFRIRERIAGIPGEAVGTVTHFEPGRAATWEAPQAYYRIAHFSVAVSEGVTWTLEDVNGGTRVSAHVCATFPENVPGRVLERAFKILGGVDRDREHTRQELAYLRRRLETHDKLAC
jgi:uncharacterized protein YndB with AHSA1/START domain